MEYINYLLFGLLLFFIIRRMVPARGVRQISTAELKNELKDKNKQIIDVRTPGEFRGSNIKGFKNLPLQQLAQKAEKELSKDKEVVVICQSGMRSQNATKMLKGREVSFYSTSSAGSLIRDIQGKELERWFQKF